MTWVFYPGSTLFLSACIVAYVFGFRKLQALEQGPKGRQAGAFALGALLLAIATVSPLNSLRAEFLFARATQQVLVAILVPPLLWYGQTVPCVSFPFAAIWQRQKYRPAPTWRVRFKVVLKFLTGPGVVWALTLCLFALWHDPSVLNWLNAVPWRANAGLWVYFSIYFLFWSHAMAVAPCWHKPMPVWIRFLYLIVGGEVSNMLVGVSLAFRPFVLYDFYAEGNVHGFPNPLQDQMISGAIIWVSGSFVYIFIAVALLAQSLFHRPLPNKVPTLDWQRATRRTIAPGLEDRVG